MSDKELNAIKEIEFRINAVKSVIINSKSTTEEFLRLDLNEIDSLLFDINDFINDLKDER